MIDRVFYKTRAKVNLKGKWIVAALVAIILLVATGQDVIKIDMYNGNRNVQTQTQMQEFFNNGTLDQATEFVPYNNALREMMNRNVFPIVGLFFIPIALLVIAAGIAFQSFLMGPLSLGAFHYFRRNDLGEAKLDISEILWAFRSPHYMNIVKIIFLKNLKLVGWYLLFIIPGIIKSYEYSMIPFILSRDPAISAEDVFAQTRLLTLGKKSSLFVLDLSFIGWYILGSIPLGLGTPFVKAYETQTKSGIFNDWVGDTEPLPAAR